MGNVKSFFVALVLSSLVASILIAILTGFFSKF